MWIEGFSKIKVNLDDGTRQNQRFELNLPGEIKGEDVNFHSNEYRAALTLAKLLNVEVKGLFQIGFRNFVVPFEFIVDIGQPIKLTIKELSFPIDSLYVS